MDIPAWPADNLVGPSGPVKFTNGGFAVPPDQSFPFQRQMLLTGRVTYGDVDGDGAKETLALVNVFIQGGGQQLLALDRSPSGRIVTLGTVVAATGPVRVIDDSSVSVRPDGAVLVRVGDYQRCCGDKTPQQWQTRAYGWNGSGFAQTGGPASFPPNASVTETGMKAGELVFGPSTGSVRHATLTMTVSYSYGTVPSHLTIVFSAPLTVRPEGDSWPPIYTPPNYLSSTFAVDVPTPARGVPKTYTFALSVKAGTTTDFQVSIAAADAKNTSLSEANPYDNYRLIYVRAAG